MAKMTVETFVNKLVDIAKNHKTLYVMGCFGAPITNSNVDRYCTNHSYNKQATRTKMIKAAANKKPVVYGFDCVCLIKGVLWGWSANEKHSYGGAKYNSNDVPDIGADGMIAKCTELSTDFNNIEVGEAVWRKGHIGIYIGDGLAVECTPAWKNCVQITACNCNKAGYNRRNWTKHGKLPYVDYSKKETVTETNNEKKCEVTLKVLKRSSKGNAVKALQSTLIMYGHSCGSKGADGYFGIETENAVKAFQKAKKITVDGCVGPQTWSKLLGVS